MKCVIGIDYGTQSARAVLVDAEAGQVLESAVVRYPHGVGEDCLAWAEDYDSALEELLEKVTPPAYRRCIAGICVDATSLTLVPVAADGRPLSCQRELTGRPHAQIKLWKRHTAQSQAEEALSLARACREPFLGRTGGGISSEWTLPKLLEIRDEDPDAYSRIDLALDLCEYLTFRLTGQPVRSVGSMSYKGLWARDLGLPSDGYLERLRPGLAKEYARVMRGTVLAPGERAGWLSAEWQARLGLSGAVAVAAGTLDGHTSLAAMGALQPGDAALVVGTSNVLTIQTNELREIEGICGIAKDGLTPGLWGIDAGQSCTGDMLEWFLQNLLPEEYAREARQRGISPHSLLAEKIREPWQNRIVAADWWNGSRNAPCNLSLPGALVGLTLASRPEDLYLALLQAIVCGTGEILEQCSRCGIPIGRLLICGGAARKNHLLMTEYANLLGRTVETSQAEETPACGAAIFAAVAAGIYPSASRAWQAMGVHRFEQIRPDPVHRAEYQRLYGKNHQLRQLLQ